MANFVMKADGSAFFVARVMHIQHTDNNLCTNALYLSTQQRDKAKKIPVFLLTRPTLAQTPDSAVFIATRKK